MDWAKEIVLEIATVSQRVVGAATLYARRKGFKNVQSCHFRLEKEMQRISVAAQGILDVLDKSSLPNGLPLDDRLEEWFSTDELPTCLDTLNQMERMLQNDTWMNNFMNTLRFSIPEDKIDTAVKLFDSRRNYFHFLLTTDVWNCEELPQQPRAPLAHAQEGAAVEPPPRPNINSAMEVDLEVTSVPLSTANRSTVIEENERKTTNDLRKIDDIMRWLDGLSCTAKQEETLSLRQPDTCTWLDSSPRYESWKNGDNSFLWFQGKPGSGKTVLASFVIDSLKNKPRSGETLAFFYCDFRNDRSTRAAEVMRSLLSQLLRHIRNENMDPGELVDGLVREKDGDTPILENVKHLASFVSQTAKQFTHQPLVVVDALDECKDVEKLLDGLLILTKGGIRLFVTSRPLQIIKDGLRGLSSISMDKMAKAVSTDIALHVTRELDSRRRLRDLELGLKTEIHSILCDRADGMFRWVQCQIDTLNQCATKAEVREALNNLPIGLDETYRRILVAIDTGLPEGKLALRALVWLVGALRPLRLLEILEALTLDLGKRTMNPDIGPLHKGALLDACSSLVTYNEDTDILILSHFSVKEYLTGDLTRTKLPQYHISFQGAHEHLARLCICYVTLHLKHVHRPCDEPSLSCILRTIDGRSRNATGEWLRFSENPPAVLSMSQELLGYVFTDGFNHLAYLGLANRAVLKDMLALQSDIQQHPDAWGKICRTSQRYKLSVPWPDRGHDFMLYILTAFASDSLLHAHLGHSRNLIKPKDQTNPLVYAAHFGKLQHAHVLLTRGAKVNEKGLAVDASHQALPLQVAVSRQHDTMVDLLLSAGSIVPKGLFARSTDRNFPIRILRRLFETDEFVEWAAEPGNRLPSPVGLLERRAPLVYERDIIIMIRRLVQVGSDPAAPNSARKTAFHFAIEGGYQAIVLYLLLIGAPFPSDFTSTSSRITRSERMSIVRLIVAAGVDVHVRDSDDTALHLVMRFLEEGECQDAVKILLAAGCKPFSRNAARRTPFQLALERGYSSVVDYLLSQTPSSDVLLAVMESRNPVTWIVGTLRALNSRGGNLCGVTAYGDTLLHRAVVFPDEHQGLELAKFLLGSGCNPFGSSANGKTPLDLALDRKSTLLADYLLSTVKHPPPNALFAILCSALPVVWKAQKIHSLVQKGADVHGFSDDGHTLLHAAVLSHDECQGLEVAKLLVGTGCDPFKCDVQGKTPFGLALDHGFPLLADYLLSTVKQPPPDALFAVLHSALPVVWKAQKIHSLVQKGADVHGLSGHGQTLFHAVVLSLDERQRLEVAKLLFGTGCDPFKPDVQGKTSFDLALDHGFPLLADCLLSTVKHPPPDALFAILRSTLSVVWKSQKICSLVRKGADVHGISDDGYTLFHAAVISLGEKHGLEVVKFLVSTGCDFSICNRQRETALHIAAERGSISVMEYILSLDQSLPEDILFSALKSRCKSPVSMLRMLISKGANTRVVGVDGNNLLHVVISPPSYNWLSSINLETISHMQMAVHTLVDGGCDPSAPNSRGITPLHLAVVKGYVPIIEYLLSITTAPDLSADILACALEGTWEVPGRKDFHTILQVLIRKGANVYVRAADGGTLLHMAIKNGAPRQSFSPYYYSPLEIIKFLVESGCDHLQRDADGHPPLYFAITKGHVDIVEYLLPRTVPLPQGLWDAMYLAPKDFQDELEELLTKWIPRP